ncbi:MAG: ergothioneine biosynthesis glutamate--cysteine ligase EgtA [Streptosporangiaceae bacterium]
MTALTIDDMYAHVRGVCFKNGPPGRVGAETEWLVVDPADPKARVPLQRLREALRLPLPCGSHVTFEPGGQLELSSLPQSGPAALCDALEEDLAQTRARLPGLELSGYGVDPVRSPLMQLDDPRYTSMGEYFGDLTMMCTTASVQVCLDIGENPVAATRRWRLAHAMGPVLVAAFANSPLQAGRRTGWKSTRQAIWSRMDRSRTTAPVGDDPVEAWLTYALDARVMLIRDPWTTDPGMTFREWMRSGSPTIDDLGYHLSTLFPPVRPQGWFELRMIDALPEPYWRVPVAVAAALLDMVPDEAEAATEPVAGRWAIAARDGLADPLLGQAALRSFEAAAGALDGPLRTLVEEYADRYVTRGRCPADEEFAWTR